MAESLHHSPETVTTLLIGYTLIQNISGVKKYKESKSTIDMLVYSVAKSCLTLCDPIDCSLPGSSVHGDSLGKNTRVDCHFLLQRIFPNQGSNPGLPHCRWFLTIWATRHFEMIKIYCFFSEFHSRILASIGNLVYDNHDCGICLMVSFYFLLSFYIY